MSLNDQFDRGVREANRDSRNGPQSKRISVKWTCSDCGKRRAGHMRNVCALCGAEVCDWCEDKHIDQHPVEARRR